MSGFQAVPEGYFASRIGSAVCDSETSAEGKAEHQDVIHDRQIVLQ